MHIYTHDAFTHKPIHMAITYQTKHLAHNPNGYFYERYWKVKEEVTRFYFNGGVSILTSLHPGGGVFALSIFLFFFALFFVSFPFFLIF